MSIHLPGWRGQRSVVFSSYLLSSSCWACCWCFICLPSCVWNMVPFLSVSVASIPCRLGDLVIDTVHLAMASVLFGLCWSADFCVCWGSFLVPPAWTVCWMWCLELHLLSMCLPAWLWLWLSLRNVDLSVVCHDWKQCASYLCREQIIVKTRNIRISLKRLIISKTINRWYTGYQWHRRIVNNNIYLHYQRACIGM